MTFDFIVILIYNFSPFAGLVLLHARTMSQGQQGHHNRGNASNITNIIKTVFSIICAFFIVPGKEAPNSVPSSFLAFQIHPCR
jgi:hypothetical protein